MAVADIGARRDGGGPYAGEGGRAGGEGVAWLTAYAIGLAASGHDDPTSERLLRDAADHDAGLLARTRARVQALTCHDERVRRRAARLLRDATPRA